MSQSYKKNRKKEVSVRGHLWKFGSLKSDDALEKKLVALFELNLRNYSTLNAIVFCA